MRSVLLLLAAAGLVLGATPRVLTQAMFDRGTVILTEPGMYVLDRDSEFNPNPRSRGGDSNPRPEQMASNGGPYDDAAYGLGFFAAVVIAGPGITLDLMGHTMTQHPEHRLQQRFYTHIELATAPFLKGQGPHDFAPLRDPDTPSTVVIRNGTLGLSSHHAIHGLGAHVVQLENLVIRDFEVAGVHLNGATDVTLTNVEVGPSTRDVPVGGTYSAARFILPYVQYLAQQVPACAADGIILAGQNRSAGSVLRALEAALEAGYQAVLHGVGAVPPVFVSRGRPGLPDGGAIFGVVLNTRGIATNGFAAAQPAPFTANTPLRLHNVTIHGLAVDVSEVVALSTPDGKAQVDAVNAALDPLLAQDAEGRYVGNALADAQLLVHQFRACFPPRFSTRRSTMQPWTLAWAASRGPLNAGPSAFVCTGDIMSHVTKGAIALRVDAGAALVVRNVTVRDVENCGPPGSRRCGKYVKDLAVATLPYYNGAHAAGVTLAASAGADLQGLVVDNITSWAGHAFGIRVLLHSSSIAGGVTVSRVSTLAGRPYGVVSYEDYPQEPPVAQNIFLDETVADCTLAAAAIPAPPVAPPSPPGLRPAEPASTPAPVSGSGGNSGHGLEAAWAAIAVIVVAVISVAVVLARSGWRCGRRGGPSSDLSSSVKTTVPLSVMNPSFVAPAAPQPPRPMRPAVVAREYVDSGSEGEDDAVAPNSTFA